MSHCDRESHSSPNGIDLERILQQIESPMAKREDLQRSGDLD
jgi:hypothetical protein